MKTSRKFFSIIILLSLVITGLPMSAMAEKSKDQTMTISSVSDLLLLEELCHEDKNTTDLSVELTADLDLSLSTFTCLNYFNGSFNGNGHTINAYKYEGNGYVFAFVRYLGEEGEIKDLTLKGSVTATDEKECIAGLVADNAGTITNCYFSGTVSGQNITGGLVGVNEACGLIEKSTSSGKISGYYYTGGVCGKNYGRITDCNNSADVNVDYAWVEGNDEMGLGLVEDLGNNESDVRFQSGVDTGGITGYSKGIIVSCTNKGTIGYEHTGYNVGGICGRQSGSILDCSNQGNVYGRKDVGGIVGQMEPYIEVSNSGSLRTEVNNLYTLIQRTLDDMEEANLGLNGDAKTLKQNADKTIASSDKLMDLLSDYADDTVTQVNSILERADYAMDKMPEALEYLEDALDGLSKTDDYVKDLSGHITAASDDFAKDYSSASDDMKAISDDLSKEVTELNNISTQLISIYDQLHAAYESSQTNLEALRAVLKDSDGKIKTTLTPSEREEVNRILDELAKVELPDPNGPEFTSIRNSLTEIDRLNKDVKTHIDSLDATLDAMVTKGNAYIKSISKDIENISGKINKMSKDLKAFTESLNKTVKYLNSLDDIQFSTLGKEFDDERSNFTDSLYGVSDAVAVLTDSASMYGTTIINDLSAVNMQMNIIFNLIMNRFEDDDGDGKVNFYTDISEEEINSITVGRVDYVENEARIYGDKNVGGIVGSMAVDEDDPEENSAGDKAAVLCLEYTTQCVLTNVKNRGKVIAKKDGAGGVVGYMSMGALVDSINTGYVLSEEGGFVGGIAGESLAVIKRCYSLCSLEGDSNLGGISGYGVSIEECISLVNNVNGRSRIGAIAGQVATEDNSLTSPVGEIKDNLYVDTGIYGIDGISFSGLCDEISYEDLVSMEGVPQDFRELKAFFMVDDEVISECSISYGQDLSNLTLPEMKKQEGYYGQWQDLSGLICNGNMIIEGSYEKIVTVLGSRNLEEVPEQIPEGTVIAYVLGQFTDKAFLDAGFKEDRTYSELSGKDYVFYKLNLSENILTEEESLSLRLYNPYEKATVYLVTDKGLTELEGKIRGSYIEVSLINNEGFYYVVDNSFHVTVKMIVIGIVILLIIVIAGLSLIVSKKKKRKKT